MATKACQNIFELFFFHVLEDGMEWDGMGLVDRWVGGWVHPCTHASMHLVVWVDMCPQAILYRKEQSNASC